jgi:hypothetical protein
MEHLEYLVKNPQGKIEDLKKEISDEEIKIYSSVGYINLSNTNYKTNQSCIDSYNPLMKEPTFFEKILGAFCHYVLRFK